MIYVIFSMDSYEMCKMSATFYKQDEHLQNLCGSPRSGWRSVAAPAVLLQVAFHTGPRTAASGAG